jgi:hypothetical protein
MADAMGDTLDIDMAFEGLSDETQNAFWRLMARPQDRLQILGGLSDQAFAEAENFWDAMTETEWVAFCRALGLAA